MEAILLHLKFKVLGTTVRLGSSKVQDFFPSVRAFPLGGATTVAILWCIELQKFTNCSKPSVLHVHGEVYAFTARFELVGLLDLMMRRLCRIILGLCNLQHRWPSSCKASGAVRAVPCLNHLCKVRK